MKHPATAVAMIIALGLLTLLPGAAQSAGHKIVAIHYGDDSPAALASAAAQVQILLPSESAPRKGVTLGEVLADGTRIDSPPRVTVILQAARDTIQVNPGASVTLVSTGAGVTARVNAGEAGFEDLPGLSFFKALAKQVLAQARGTKFIVRANDQGVTISCDAGAVDVSYAATVKIQASNGQTTTPVQTFAVWNSANSSTIVAASPAGIVETATVTANSGSHTFSQDAVKPVASLADALQTYQVTLRTTASSQDADAKAIAYNNVGVLDLLSGNLASALDNLTKAIQFGHFPISYASRATLYLIDSKLDLASSDLDAALRIDPDFAYALNDRAVILTLRGDLSGALLNVNRAIHADPNFALAYTNRASVMIAGFFQHPQEGARKAFDDATRDLDTALRIDPNSAEAFFLRGFLRSLNGTQKESQSDFSKAISIRPSFSDAYAMRAMVEAGHDDPKAARTDLDAAIALGPQMGSSLTMAYLMRGSLDLGESDDAGAIADALAGIKAATNAVDELLVPGAYVVLGNAYMAQGKLDLAIDAYNRGLNPELDRIIGFPMLFNYQDRGAALLYANRFDEARADFEHATQFDATNLDNYLWLEVIARRTGAPSRLRAQTAKLNLREWPGPLVRLFLGELKPSDVLGNAASSCDASFFIAEFDRSVGDQANAKMLYTKAASACGHGDVEGRSALEALRLTP